MIYITSPIIVLLEVHIQVSLLLTGQLKMATTNFKWSLHINNNNNNKTFFGGLNWVVKDDSCYLGNDIYIFVGFFAIMFFTIYYLFYLGALHKSLSTTI